MKIKTLEINEPRHEVFIVEGKKRKEVRLAPKEFAILSELRDAGVTLSREALLEKCWDSEAKLDKVNGTRTVDQHVARMRRKLGKTSFILTDYCYGYKFVGA